MWQKGVWHICYSLTFLFYKRRKGVWKITFHLVENNNHCISILLSNITNNLDLKIQWVSTHPPSKDDYQFPYKKSSYFQRHFTSFIIWLLVVEEIKKWNLIKTTKKNIKKKPVRRRACCEFGNSFMRNKENVVWYIIKLNHQHQ